MTTALVYVQLGENPSKTLYLFATQAKRALSQSELYLLTDNPNLWKEFPGRILDISLYNENSGYLRFRNQNRHLERIAGGYWLNTLKRLFVLEVMQDYASEWNDLVHFESDVYSFLSDEMIECLRDRVPAVAVPRFSENRGIASVVYVRSQTALKKMISDLSQILFQKPNIRDDMELLGVALAIGAVSELPSLPTDGWDWNGERYIFDGAAYGQYFFGQDPFHTEGFIISGFQNPHFSFDISSVKWRLEKQPFSNVQLKFQLEENDLVLANLHIHSKIPLSESSTEDPLWKKYLDEANKKTIRTPIESNENSPHSEKLDLKTRFRIAQKKGLLKSLYKKLLKLIKS
jgi:hypothetical protein